MKVELSIKDDSELRNMVKDMIRGQVKSLLRNGIEEEAKKEISRKARELTISNYRVENAIKEEARKFSSQIKADVVKSIVEELRESAKEQLLRYARSIIDENINDVIRSAISNRIANLKAEIVVKP